MSEELRNQVLRYLESHNTMTLGTSSGDQPWAATVFYASDGFELYFFSSPDSRHCQNLTENPRVAVTIQEDYKDWRKIKGIQLEGTVGLVDSTLERAKAMAVYARKYPDVIKLFTNPASGVFHQAFLKVKFYCVRPTTVFFIDNEQGFGQRREIRLKDAATAKFHL
ncbi:MAG TPA: pyridoxamine 5'-phosphate oxidase family protein [Candidatus Eisenbacteria bacterium]|nr:pyridoxamine 5'-phosphate oxidase family protein [Candidatus Eisenbacteria bacterium]